MNRRDQLKQQIKEHNKRMRVAISKIFPDEIDEKRLTEQIKRVMKGIK